MKKTILFSLLIIGMITKVNAQFNQEEINKKACECVSTIEPYDIASQIDKCIIKSTLSVAFDDGKVDESKLPKVIDAALKGRSQTLTYIRLNCREKIDSILQEKEKHFYKLSDDKEASELYKKAASLNLKGKHQESVEFLEKAIEKDSTFVIAYDDLAVSYRRTGNKDKAIELYKKSLEIYPEGSAALRNIAIVYQLDRDYEKAFSYYEKIKTLYPADPEGYYGAGGVLLAKGELEEALKNYSMAYKLYEIMGQKNFVSEVKNILQLIKQKFEEQGRGKEFEDTLKQFKVTL